MTIYYDKPIKVEGKEGKKDAASAEAAVREIEEKAHELNKADNVLPNILRMKDPSSRFITAQDVIREQAALNLGITSQIKSKGLKIMSGGFNPAHLSRILDNSKQSCPTCSLELNSPFPMEWIETAEIFRCVRCTIEINPFAKENEPLPTEPTNFGLSAIHDINQEPLTPEGVRNKYPIVTRRKKTTAFKDLDKRKDEASIDRRLRRRFT